MKIIKNMFFGVSLLFLLLTILKLFLQYFSLESPVLPNALSSVSQNHVKLLVNGAKSFNQRLANLKDASVVMIKTFEFHDDISGQELVAKLNRLAKNGSLIFIQFDVKGTDNYPKDYANIYHKQISPIPFILQKLANDNPNHVYLFPTNAPFHFREYFFGKIGIHFPVDHEKYFITWNKNHGPIRVVLGGMNIGDAYLKGGAIDKKSKHFFKQKNGEYPWRDTDIEITGPVSKLIVERFIKEAKFQEGMFNSLIPKHFRATPNEGIKKLKDTQNQMNADSSSYQIDSLQGELVNLAYISKNIFTNDIEKDLIIRLNEVPSHEIVTLVSPYFLPTNKLEKAIIAAAQRGVRFVVLTDGSKSSVSNFSKIAKIGHHRIRYLWRNSPKNSIKFYQYLGSPTIGLQNMHQKIWVLGKNKNAQFAIGSSNLDSHSLRINSEDMVWLQSASLKAQIDAMIQNDLSSKTSVELTSDTLSHEGWLERLTEFNLDLFFSPII